MFTFNNNNHRRNKEKGLAWKESLDYVKRVCCNPIRIGRRKTRRVKKGRKLHNPSFLCESRAQCNNILVNTTQVKYTRDSK